MKFFRMMTLLLAAVTLFFSACGGGGGDDGDGNITVTFLSATQSGGTSAMTDSTSLILTFSLEPTTLSADDITLTGATKGGLSGSGTSRNLTISNITVADGETVTVTITNPAGYSITGSPQSAVVYRVPYIGMPYQGGVIAYIYQVGDPGYVSGEYHGLIAATADQSTATVWAKPAYESTLLGGTGQALGDGSNNTDKIITQNSADTTYAAGIARAYNGGGFTDWYLPSYNELSKLYLNRNAIGGFAVDYYWSSSEYDTYSAYLLDLSNGWIDGYQKYHDGRVRAVRAF